MAATLPDDRLKYAPPRDLQPRAAPPRDMPGAEAAPATGAPPAPPGPGDRKAPGSGPSNRQDYWDRIDNLFYKTVARAEQAFHLNLAVNTIVVAVGIGLVAYSVALSWFRGVDLATTGFAGIGVASFVALFFFNPQKYIHKSVGNLVQVQIAYRTYLSQFEALADYDRQRHQAGGRTLQDVKDTNAAWGQVSREAIALIETYVERDAPVAGGDDESPGAAGAGAGGA